MQKTRKEYDYQILEAIKLFEKGFNIKEISKKLGTDRHNTARWIKKSGFTYPKNGKFVINSSIFSIIDNEPKAYWLGFLFADGYVSRENSCELTLAERDLSHLEKFKSFLDYKGGIKYRGKQRAYRLSFRDSTIAERLKSLGCINKKSLTLKFPSTGIPKELISHFIRGYFDGDGSINDPVSPIRLQILGTKEFLEGLLATIDFNMLALKRDKRHNKNTHYISLCGQNARDFCDFMYTKASIYLERKKDRFLKHQDNYDRFKRKNSR